MPNAYLPRGRLAGALFVCALGAATSSCAAKVNQDVFDREIAQLRGDVGDLDTRVTANRQDLEAMSRQLDALQVDLESLREEYDVVVSRLEKGIRFATPVHFEFDESEIRPQDRPLLERFAGVVGNHYEGAVVTVEGFADPAGSMAYNQALSERRAQSVASYLQAEGGLSADMLKTVGYGEDRQVVPGAQGPGEAGVENRRVTFVIEYAPDSESLPVTADADAVPAVGEGS